jgi:hypothetical protein
VQQASPLPSFLQVVVLQSQFKDTVKSRIFLISKALQEFLVDQLCNQTQFELQLKAPLALEHQAQRSERFQGLLLA